MKNELDKNYPNNLDTKIKLQLNLLSSLNNELKTYRNLESNLWKTILFKLKVDWTYNSNSIEGSTLTKGDTIFFLKEGLTSKGKPFKDYIDTKNHSEAIDFLFDIISNKRELTEGVIKEINALLLQGVTSTPAKTIDGQVINKKAHPGQYKLQENHVLQQDGTIHKYVDPLHVQSEMELLLKWVNENIDVKHPCYVAAVAHYNMVRIHPFDDGNGRGARILMNLILLKKDFFPAVIKVENRQDYIEFLQEADNNSLESFITFVGTELIKTMEGVMSDLKKNNSTH